MTRREFYKSSEMDSVRKSINACAILGYIVAALSLVANLLLLDNPSGIIDTILIVILSILIQTIQSRVAAVILCVYGVINMAIITMYTGRFGGWWILVVGVFAAINTFKFHKAWKEEKEFEVEKAQLRQDL
jgi:membrane-bound ClpP family serine protease